MNQICNLKCSVVCWIQNPKRSMQSIIYVFMYNIYITLYFKGNDSLCPCHWHKHDRWANSLLLLHKTLSYAKCPDTAWFYCLTVLMIQESRSALTKFSASRSYRIATLMLSGSEVSTKTRESLPQSPQFVDKTPLHEAIWFSPHLLTHRELGITLNLQTLLIDLCPTQTFIVWSFAYEELRGDKLS